MTGSNTASPTEIFSRLARRHLLRRAGLAGVDERWIIDRLSRDMIERLSAVRRTFESVLRFGHSDPPLDHAIRSTGARIVTQHDVMCDEDRPPFADGSFDLILVNGMLDTVNDLPGALILMRRMLKHDGLLIGWASGAGALPTLRSVVASVDASTQRFHPQIDVRAFGDLLLRGGFSQPVVDEDRIEVRYGSLDRLVGDLRANGLTNILPDRQPISRAAYRTMADEFRNRARGGKTSETFAFLHFTGWSSVGQ